MVRRPPRSTRTDTLFPYTTLFRSRTAVDHQHVASGVEQDPRRQPLVLAQAGRLLVLEADAGVDLAADHFRSEEHTSELQSLMRISYAVFCLKKKTQTTCVLTLSRVGMR